MTDEQWARSRLRRQASRPWRATGALAMLVGLLLGTSGAEAAPFVEVEYDLSDSTSTAAIPLIGASSSTPPDGTLHGSQTIRYTSGSGTSLVPGAVELITFNLTLSSVAVQVTNYTGTVTVNTTDLHIEFLGLTNTAATGQLLTGGTVTPLGANGRFRMTGTLHCFNYCGLLRVYATQPVKLHPDEFTAPLPALQTGTTGGLHTVQGTATSVTFFVKPYSVGLGQPNGVRVVGTTFLVGREVNRTPVPEPSTLPLLAAGLAGLALAAVAWKRRVSA